MTIDIAKLKALAEAAKNDCGDYVALNDYGMAVPPAVMLELIGRLEVSESMEGLYTSTVTVERAELGQTKRELDQLKAENEVARMRIKELDLLFGRYILAMRAAVIDEECGGHGMKWIYNSLRGPGELPPEDEQDAQAYFDREIVAVDNGMQEVLAFHDKRRAMSKDAMKKTGD